MKQPVRKFTDEELALLAALTAQDALMALRLLDGSEPSAVRRMLTREQERAARLTDLQRTGEIVLLVWLLEMISLVKQTHAAAALAANPAVDTSPSSPFGKRVAAQVKYLGRFADDLAAKGKASLIPAPAVRARQYPAAAWGTYWAVRRSVARNEGQTEERSLTRPAEHCPECPELEKRGWVTIGTTPLPGDRQCKNGCLCVMEYR